MEKVNLGHYIRMTVESELDKTNVKRWYNTVKKNLPDGVLGSYSTNNDEGPATSSLIHTRSKNLSEYDIPLNRHLNENEIETVVNAWNDSYLDGDFDIEGSSMEVSFGDNKIEETAEVVNTDFKRLISERFKRELHKEFYKEKTNEGWRYGIMFDPKEKTDPRLQPWDNLTESLREENEIALNVLLNIIKEEGYQIKKSR